MPITINTQNLNLTVNDSADAGQPSIDVLPATSSAKPFASKGFNSYDAATGTKTINFIAAKNGRRYSKLTLVEEGVTQAESDEIDAALATEDGELAFATEGELLDDAIHGLEALVTLTRAQRLALPV